MATEPDEEAPDLLARLQRSFEKAKAEQRPPTPDPLAYLDAVDARVSGATPGPWEVRDLGDEVFTSENNRGWWWVYRSGQSGYAGVMEMGADQDGSVGHAAITDHEDGERERRDADLIAAAPADLAAMSAALRAVLAKAQRIREGGRGQALQTFWDGLATEFETVIAEHLGGTR